MAIISLPSKFSFTAVKTFKLQRAGNTTRSKYTGVRQTIVYPFAVWVFEGTLVDYDGADAAAIRSFLMQLEGQRHSFRLPVPGYSRPSTGYTGNALINGAVAARATSMAIDGMTVSIPILAAGDYFTVNDELKMCVSSFSSNASGQATVSFLPAMRKPLADNAAVTMQNPTVLLHAQDMDVAEWGLSPPFRHKVKIDAIEVVEA